jgi:hypothetical protein
MNNVQVRREILTLLYDLHNRDPHGAIELDELARQLDLSPNKVSSNVKYLCDPEKELAKLKKTTAGSQRVYTFVRITAAGIDLVDAPNEFNARFPPQVTYQYQYVAGDNLEVTIGDNASEVTVGKDIVKLQFGADHTLEDVFAKFVDSVIERSNASQTDEEGITTQLKRLRYLLQQGEGMDLGEAQRIKESLVEQEGSPPAGTIALFSHPAVVGPIQKAVERLIGHSRKSH